MTLEMTPKAIEVIEKHIKTGYIINPYSEEWHQKNDGVKLINDEHCEKSVSLDELPEYDEQYGTDYRDHFLIAYVESHNFELIEDLSNLYEPIKQVLEEKGRHKPNFLFINLSLGKVFCLGVGRKYRLFGYDVDEYVSGSKDSINPVDLVNENIYGVEISPYLLDFQKLDHLSILANIVVNLEILSNANYEWNSLAYEDEDEDEEDGESESSNELNQCEEKMDRALNGLMIYFPMIDSGDLNPQDY